MREDLARTQLAIGRWASQGADVTDPKRLVGIISFTNVPLHAKFQGLVAKAMQLRGYTPVVFTYSGCRFGHKYFRLFGIDRLIMWDQLVEASATVGEVEEIARVLLPDAPTVAQITATRFHGVQVGKHALSMTCRRRIEGKLDLADASTLGFLREELGSAVRAVLTAERFLEEFPVEKMLVRDCGYTPNGAIFEASLRRGADCVVYDQGLRRGTWVLKRYSADTLGPTYFSLSGSTWDEIKHEPWTAEHEAELKREFAGRYRSDSTDDTRRLQSGKQLKTPEEVRGQLGLDASKKTAVIFSHLAWDAAFFFGTCLFDDFEDWLLETVKFVSAECRDLNWVVKLHPFNVFKLQRENKKEESELRLLQPLMPLPPHVRLMRADTDINTQSLFAVVDYVLTVNGTVGMEFPCFGIPAVVTGTGRYEGRGFTLEPKSREEYFALLRTLHRIPRLDSSSQELAKKHFLALMTRRQYSIEDIAPMELKRVNEAQSNVADNIGITARSLEEFQQASSMRHLGEWLAESRDPDLLTIRPSNGLSSRRQT